jgi:hypothetical protein
VDWDKDGEELLKEAGIGERHNPDLEPVCRLNRFTRGMESSEKADLLTNGRKRAPMINQNIARTISYPIVNISHSYR